MSKNKEMMKKLSDDEDSPIISCMYYHEEKRRVPYISKIFSKSTVSDPNKDGIQQMYEFRIVEGMEHQTLTSF